MGGSAISGQQASHSFRGSISLNSVSKGLKPVDNVARSMSADTGNSGAHFSLENFVLGRVIGTGSCSYARIATCRSLDRPVVIKTFSKAQLIKSEELRHCRNELQALGSIRSPWIPRFLGSGQDQRTVFLVMDFIPGGELFRLLRTMGRLTLREVEFYAAEVFCALSDLHMWRFIYRDLKPEHLLLDCEGHLKLVDLHLTKFVKSGGKTSTLCGTPEYMAPEMIERTGASYEADWWQFGILLYELLSGKTPFYDTSPHVLYTKILTAEVRFPGFFSHSACALISSLLNKHPKKRPTSDQIKSDPFFSAVDWPRAESKLVSPPLINRVSSPEDDSHFETFEEFEVLEEDVKVVEDYFVGF